MFPASLTVSCGLGLRDGIGEVLEDLVALVGHLLAHVWQTPVAHFHHVHGENCSAIKARNSFPTLVCTFEMNGDKSKL